MYKRQVGGEAVHLGEAVGVVDEKPQPPAVLPGEVLLGRLQGTCLLYTSRGQTFTQQPQATQADGSTTALRRFFTEFIACLPKLSGFIIPHIYELHRDEITNAAGRIAPHAPA